MEPGGVPCHGGCLHPVISRRFSTHASYTHVRPWPADERIPLNVSTVSFDDFGFDDSLLRAVKACGFTTPTPVQAQAIPPVMAGRDLLASAQTGTGKTAAFLLPILHRLRTRPAKPGRGPRALILSPTRELAGQIADAVRDLGRFSGVRFGSVVGGMGYGPQHRLLGGSLDILVATPGRLMDHMEQGRVTFPRLEVLVLDEADRMLDMGFAPAVERIAAALPKERQTLLFSATLEGSVLNVARRHQKDPATVRLAHATMRHEAISQWMHEAGDPAHKRAVLERLLGEVGAGQALIFTATKRGAKRLAAALEAGGHACDALHGNMTQAARLRTMTRMRRGGLRVLVATDVAARGLDVPGISHVINFDLPRTAEDYIHRIGRTGRAGAQGVAISLVGRAELPQLRQIERLTGRPMERRVLNGLEAPRYEAATALPRNGGRPPYNPGRRSGSWGRNTGRRGNAGRG
jgi:superfamily II DNA/RNA helicase